MLNVNVTFDFTFCLMNCFRSAKAFTNDSLGCNSVSWAPYVGAYTENNSHIFRLATGSCDNNVRIWKFMEGVSSEWTEEPKASLDASHKGDFFTLTLFLFC